MTEEEEKEYYKIFEENKKLKKDKKELIQLFKNYKKVISENARGLKEIIDFYEKS